MSILFNFRLKKIIDWIGITNEGVEKIAKLSFLIPNAFGVYIIVSQGLLRGESYYVIWMVVLLMLILLSFSWFCTVLIVVRTGKWLYEVFKK